MKIQTINPATESVITTYETLNDLELNTKLNAAHIAFSSWKKSSFHQRSNLMFALVQIMKNKSDELSALITAEMGKPIMAAKAEINKCIVLCEHYAEHAEIYLKPRSIQTEMKLAKVCYAPLGVIFAIMPWNFPFWQVFRFAIPTLMAGNVVLLKHAPISTGTGEEIERLFLQAGFPKDVLQHLIINNEGAAQVIQDPKVAAVSLTGSEGAGSAVAAHAGKFLKKTVLELGGCDPYVVLADADLDLAAQCCVDSRLGNSGQVCIAAKRIIVIQSVAQELIAKIERLMSHYAMGDPQDPEVKLGPLARSDLRDKLQLQVENSIKYGAKLLKGGIIPDIKGFYYPATLLTNVTPGMPAFDEELFGPVIAVTTAKDEEEAIQLANHSSYGLGAAVFTRDLSKGEQIATHEIEAGVCFVNALVASDPCIPFGGIKRSGYGRELSREGILEYVNIKTIAINDAK